MKPTTFNIGITSSLILLFLWTYTGLDKVLNWQKSWRAIHNQTFPAELAEVLSYAVPIAELLVAGLLLFSATNWWGFLGSVLLLTVFNTYVGLIWAGAFPRVPCNCAGLMEQLGWAEHFYLNILLTAIAVTGLKRSRPTPAITANQ